MKTRKYQHKSSAKKTLYLVLALVLAMSGLTPVVQVAATEHGSGDYRLKVGMDDLNGATLNSLTVNEESWNNDQDEFLSEDGMYYIAADYQLAAEDVGFASELMTSGDLSPYFENTAGLGDSSGRVNVIYAFDYARALSDGFDFNRISLQVFVERGDEPGPGPDEPQGNAEATIRVRGGEGSFDDSVYDEDGNLIEERIVNYADTYYEGSFSINSDWFHQPMPEDQVEGEDYSEMQMRYDDDPDSDSVIIGFATLWHMRYVDTITINNVDYDIPVNYDDQLSYLEHYSGQVVSFGIEVPKANDNLYDIVVKIGRSDQTWIGNFLWTADPEQQYEKFCDENNLDEEGNPTCEIMYDEEGNPIPGRDYIGNSSLALLEISYTVGNMYYHCSAREDNAYCEWYPIDNEEDITICNPYEDDDCNIPYLEFDSGDGEYDDGSLVVPAGATITMRVIPDYGYQVMNVNMADLVVSDTGIGEFTFTVPAGAAYFVADVVPVDDVVNTMTDLVVDGSIDLGDGQTTLDHGSARLDVKDIDLTNEEIAGFEGAAEGYEIKNYLDISLYNVTCKGAEVCTGTDEDSWNERIHDLREPATITLQLEDGVDGNEVVIVHQKDDGTYEVIPTIYDAATNTLTFTTSSFSNYAIASRTINTPNTGIFTIVGGSAVAASTIGGVFVALAGAGLALRTSRRTKDVV